MRVFAKRVKRWFVELEEGLVFEYPYISHLLYELSVAQIGDRFWICDRNLDEFLTKRKLYAKTSNMGGYCPSKRKLAKLRADIDKQLREA